MSFLLKFLNNDHQRQILYFLLILFLLVQFVLYTRIGIFTELEAEKYIVEGQSLFNSGHLTEPKYIFYLPVILLVYLCTWIGSSFLPVIIVQVIISGLSAFYFFQLGKRLGGIGVAFFSTLVLILFFPLQTWNFYLYTDSIFISLTIIYSYFIFTRGDQGIKGTLLILAFLGLLLFSRPHGMLFIPPTIIYLLLRRQSRTQLTISAGLCLALLASMYFLLNAAFTGGGDMDAMKPFIEEHIICFVPLKPEGALVNFVRTANPVNDLFYYIFHNPMHFLRLMGLRLLSFFNMTRSYYSTAHNLYLLFYFIPVYVFALAGLRPVLKRFRNFSIFLFSLIILYPLGATFQCDDWHSRFTLVVFPYLILLACIGADRLFFTRKITA